MPQPLRVKLGWRNFCKILNLNIFFEVVPIVDDGEFATLKRVESSNLGIIDDKIDRFTRLSNLGLGKDRVASGGELIDEHFDGLARISYAVEGVKMHNKSNFIVEVYR